MMILDRISGLALALVVVSLPFEFQTTLAGLSNLQWLIVVAILAGAPGLRVDWKQGIRSRLLAGALALAVVFWLSAIVADADRGTAFLGAARITAGVLVAAVVFRQGSDRMLTLWSGTSVAASVLALADFFVWPFATGWFRTDDFFVGGAERLSATFEYPNTAAAYFALSLPILWLSTPNRTLRLAGASLLWIALLLTYSRGAMVAALAGLAVVWWLQHRSRASGPAPNVGIGGIAGIALGSTLIAVMLLPMGARLSDTRSGNPVSASYRLEFTGLSQQPGVRDRMRVTITNDGSAGWVTEGPEAVTLMYRWFDIDANGLLDTPTGTSRLPAPVAAGEVVRVDAPFQTPARAGRYLLIWDLQLGPTWFSRLRILPVYAEVEIAPGAERLPDDRDLSHWLPSNPTPRLDASVSRIALWRAGVAMFSEHPILGQGPDRFRLLYGEYLDSDQWDTAIRANSVYVGLAATAGVAGLAAFLWTVAGIRWRVRTAAPLVVFLVHGLVDDFLMTTPIYAAFWILMGLNAASPDDASAIPTASDRPRTTAGAGG